MLHMRYATVADAVLFWMYMPEIRIKVMTKRITFVKYQSVYPINSAYVVLTYMKLFMGCQYKSGNGRYFEIYSLEIWLTRYL
jgi:hypothetical protein